MRAVALLALLGSGCTHLVWYGHSDDRRHVAAVIEEGGAQWVRFDAVEGPRVKGVALEGLAFGPDGHFAYPAQVAAGWVVFHDGTPSAAFDGIGAVALSPDGRHLAFAAQRAGGWHVVHDGVVGERFESIFPGSLRFGPGGRLVYAARRGEASFVVLDGRASEPWDGVGRVELSADGQRVAWLARRGAQAFLVVDGQGRGPYAGVAAHHFGPPEVTVVDDGGWRLLVDGAPSEAFSAVGAVRVEGGRVAATVRRQGHGWVLDGSTWRGPFDAVHPTLARDAAGALVFAAKEGADWFVFRGAERSGPWVQVDELLVAGAHVAFLGVRAERDVVVLDGRERSSWDYASSLALSPDGTRLAHLAKRGARWRVVVDGVEREVDLALEGSVAFSRSGRRVGCVTGDRQERRLRFTFDDGTSRPLDFEELVATSARRSPDDLPASDPGLLRRWVAAELERDGGP